MGVWLRHQDKPMVYYFRSQRQSVGASHKNRAYLYDATTFWTWLRLSLHHFRQYTMGSSLGQSHAPFVLTCLFYLASGREQTQDLMGFLVNSSRNSHFDLYSDAMGPARASNFLIESTHKHCNKGRRSLALQQEVMECPLECCFQDKDIYTQKCELLKGKPIS